MHFAPSNRKAPAIARAFQNQERFPILHGSEFRAGLHLFELDLVQHHETLDKALLHVDDALVG